VPIKCIPVAISEIKILEGEELTPSHRRYAKFTKRLWFLGKVATHNLMESRDRRKISSCSAHRWLSPAKEMILAIDSKERLNRWFG
jgi:hypothetical protein